MSGNNNLHQLLSATAEVIADKDRRIPELKTALAKSDQGKEMKKWYTEVVNKDSDRIETIGEQVQQAVALISPQLHMQRRINNGLGILAEHLNACFNGTKLLPDPLNELEVAKDVVQRLADGDQVIRINRELEMLCHNIQLGIYKVTKHTILKSKRRS